MDPWRQCFVVKDAKMAMTMTRGDFSFISLWTSISGTLQRQHVEIHNMCFFFSGEVWWWSPSKIQRFRGLDLGFFWSIQIEIHLDLGHTGWGRRYIARWPSGGGGAWWWQGANWKEMNVRKTWEAFVKSNSWKSRHKNHWTHIFGRNIFSIAMLDY